MFTCICLCLTGMKEVLSHQCHLDALQLEAEGGVEGGTIPFGLLQQELEVLHLPLQHFLRKPTKETKNWKAVAQPTSRFKKKKIKIKTKKAKEKGKTWKKWRKKKHEKKSRTERKNFCLHPSTYSKHVTKCTTKVWLLLWWDYTIDNIMWHFIYKLKNVIILRSLL